jgi:hypothetical protein
MASSSVTTPPRLSCAKQISELPCEYPDWVPEELSVADTCSTRQQRQPVVGGRVTIELPALHSTVISKRREAKARSRTQY